MCYINEALENQQLDLMWNYDEEGILHVDIHRSKDGDGSDYDRIFATRIKYE
jgi:hypothetical protein